MKLNQLFKEEVQREKESRVLKDMSIKKLEQEVERLQEELDRAQLTLEKKDERLKLQTREINSLQSSIELLKDQMKSNFLSSPSQARDSLSFSYSEDSLNTTAASSLNSSA